MRLQGHTLPREVRAGRRALTAEGAEGSPGGRLASQALVAIFVLLILLTLFLMALSFPVGIYTVFFTDLSKTYTASTPISSIYIFLGPFVSALPVSGTIGSIFLAVSAVYAVMLVAAGRQGAGLVRAVREAVSGKVSALFSNTLLATVIGTGFLYFTVLMIDNVETTGGVPVGGLSGDPMSLFAGLALAPLREEFGFRLLLIGTVAFLISIARPAGPTLRAFWRPSASYEGVDNVAIPWVAIGFALAASSVAFGIAHVSSDAGWQIGKLPEAAFAGAVLGFLYIKYGFHAAVLAHWGIDYLGSAYSFFGQGVYGVPWTSDTGFVLQEVLVVDIVVLGIASFLAVVYVGLDRYLRGRNAAGSEL